MSWDDVIQPIQLNPIKHHLGFIRSIVHEHQKTAELPGTLLKTGNAQTDLYIGALSIKSVCQEALDVLSDRRIKHKTAYSTFLQERQGYFAHVFSDDSSWIFRRSEHPDRYVHLHPGRHAAQTCRVNGATLKTAIAVCVLKKEGHINVNMVNEVRTAYLDLSPVRRISTNYGIGKLIRMILGDGGFT